MIENLLNVGKYFISLVTQLTVLFLGISTFIEVVLQYIPKEKISAWLSRRGIVGNFLGATLGALTPF